jgi:hypothetical protein
MIASVIGGGLQPAKSGNTAHSDAFQEAVIRPAAIN